MYVINQWNGYCDRDYEKEIVAGFLTLEEASAWCYAQKPTRRWYNEYQAIPTKDAFEILYIEGESVTVIPYPWKDEQ
jgi:hypothetical protein